MDHPPHVDKNGHTYSLQKSVWQATRKQVNETLQPVEQVLERDFAKKALNFAALVLIVLGGITKIIESLSISINSDTANSGLFSMESYLHNNPLLIGHISLSYDPYYFPELYPIYHVTQVLSGYSPDVLKLTALAVFFINIVIFAYIVFMTTKSWTSALVFSALIINLPPLSFINYAQPFWHNGALLIAGICLVLTIWYLDDRKRSCPRWCIGAVSLALLYMTFFSDYILGIWVIIPVLLSYLFLQDRRIWHNRLYFLGVLLCIPLMYTAKEVFLPDLVRYKIGFADSAGMVVNHFQDFIQQLFVILSGLQITSQECLAVLGFVFIVLLCFTGSYLIRKERQTRIPLPHILLFSVLVIFLVYLLSGWVTEGEQRYLTFQGFAIYMLALILLHKYKVVLPALLILGFVFLGMNIPAVLTPVTPNASEYTLIEELERQNLTHGLGDYWVANLVTYLSEEKVTVRAVNFKTTPSGQNEIKLFPYNTFSAWMQESMKIRRPIFVLVKESEHPGLAESIVRGGLAGLRPEPPPSVISNGDYRIILFPALNATGR